jgi:beta-galactosidase
VATQNGRAVARDEIGTAGSPRAITLTPDTRVIAADGYSLSFLTLEVVDHGGALVPDASNLIQFRVAGPGTLAGVDNGQQENAQSYQASSVPAFNGKALVIVRSTRQAGHVTVTARSPGLDAARATLRSVSARQRNGIIASAGKAGAPAAPAVLLASTADAQAPIADASYSGAPDTIPAAMLDGDLATGWSNFYNKSGTANLHAVSASPAADWVSVSWPGPQSFGSVQVYFTTSATLALPASLTVSYWDGHRFVSVNHLTIDWATASNQPTTLTFDLVHSSRVRLDMTGPAPGTAAGFLRIAELQVLSNGVNIA